MTEHRVKSWPEMFELIESGRKTFELRKNDRDYKADDVIVLQEWEPNTKAYSGRECRKLIKYVMDGIGSVGVIEPLKGLSIGYAILGLGEDESRAA